MNRRRWQKRRGVAAVELAVMLPLLVTLLMGVWEIGRALDSQIILENAAGVGARQASTGTFTNSQAQQAVIDYLQAAGLPTQNAVVTVEDTANVCLDVSQATQMDQLQVTVSVPYHDVSWGVSGPFLDASTHLTATARSYSSRVDPYPTDINLPPAW